MAGAPSNICRSRARSRSASSRARRASSARVRRSVMSCVTFTKPTSSPASPRRADSETIA